MGGIVGSRRILTFLLCLHFLFSVAGAEQLQGCSGTPSMAFLEAFAFAWEVLECYLFFQHFLCSWHAFNKWSHLGLSSGSADFPYMLLCLGSPLHCGYYVKVGVSSSMTLSCCCRGIQKWSCFPGLTGRQTGSSHLNWMVSSFNKKRRRKLLKVAGVEGRLPVSALSSFSRRHCDLQPVTTSLSGNVTFGLSCPFRSSNLKQNI